MEVCVSVGLCTCVCPDVCLCACVFHVWCMCVGVGVGVLQYCLLRMKGVLQYIHICICDTQSQAALHLLPFQ